MSAEPKPAGLFDFIHNSSGKKATYLFLAVGIVIGIVSTLTATGCSEAARRTLEIEQFLSDKTSDGHFRIDTSQIPKGGIEELKENRRKPGVPETKIKLNNDYEFEIVIRPVANKDKSGE